jgi:hypothetical protein
MQNAYGDFVEQVAALNQSETDYSVIIRALNLTRIEFASLETGDLVTVVYLLSGFINPQGYNMQMFPLDIGMFENDIRPVAITKFLHIGLRYL